jgi:hypothetical protein
MQFVMIILIFKLSVAEKNSKVWPYRSYLPPPDPIRVKFKVDWMFKTESLDHFELRSVVISTFL